MNYENLKAITDKKEAKKFSPKDGIRLLLCKLGDVLFTKDLILVFDFFKFPEKKRKKENRKKKEGKIKKRVLLSQYFERIYGLL